MAEQLTHLLTQSNQDCLAIDLQGIANQCRQLKQALPGCDLRFALKACPIPAVLEIIAFEGLGFDAASVAEIEMALAAGAAPERIHYGNTIKSADAIKRAYELGIRDFVTDSREDVQLIGENAANVRVFCRIATSGDGALWGLSEKFGCQTEQALPLLQEAKQLGLIPAGISAHVGSQQMDNQQWLLLLREMQHLSRDMQEQDLQPLYFNLGGGLPAKGYNNKAGEALSPDTHEMFAIIRSGISELRNQCPSQLAVILEPGRHIVAEHGAIRCQVMRVSQRQQNNGEQHYWLYLSCGKFNGLYETDALRFNMVFPDHSDDEPRVPAILAGPTCDSDDVLSHKHQPIAIPQSLKSGDVVWIFGCGAYSHSYNMTAFNGFTPLPVVCAPLQGAQL